MLLLIPKHIVQPPHLYSNQQKQIQTLNKLCSNLLEKLNNPRDDRDAESAGVFLSRVLCLGTSSTCSVLTSAPPRPSTATEQALLQPCRHQRLGGRRRLREGAVQVQASWSSGPWAPRPGAHDEWRPHPAAGHYWRGPRPAGSSGRSRGPAAAGPAR